MKGYSYVCATCAERFRLLRVLMDHVRLLHDRQLHTSEFQLLTSRQATQLALDVRAKES